MTLQKLKICIRCKESWVIGRECSSVLLTIYYCLSTVSLTGSRGRLKAVESPTVYESSTILLSPSYSPSPSSSRSSWRSCVSAGGPRDAGGSRWDLPTCWTASPPASLRPSAYSLHWCSRCDTCGMSSSPAGEAPQIFIITSLSLRQNQQLCYMLCCLLYNNNNCILLFSIFSFTNVRIISFSLS